MKKSFLALSAFTLAFALSSCQSPLLSSSLFSSANSSLSGDSSHSGTVSSSSASSSSISSTSESSSSSSPSSSSLNEDNLETPSDVLSFYFPGQPQFANTAYSSFAYSTSGTSLTITGYSAAVSDAATIVDIAETYKIGSTTYTVTAIGDYAFLHANALNNNTYGVGIHDITLPKTVTAIGDYAFKGLNLLTRLVVPDDSELTSLGDGTFAFCYQLANLYLPNTITTIPANCFYQCNAFGESSRLVYSYASALTSTKETIDATQRGLYGKNSGASVYSHDLTSLLSFREAAFAYCSSLASFTCPANLDFIDNYCFRNDTALKTVTFNSYLRKIGDYAFQGCTAFAKSGASCDFSSTNCPYLEDVGINVFNDTTLVTTSDDGTTSSSDPAFITTVFPFYVAYGWAIDFNSAATDANNVLASATTTFTIADSIYGLARDVLSLIPACHTSTAFPSSYNRANVDTTHAVSVTISANLVHASNNFIRLCGDDLNTTNYALADDLSGSCGLAFTTLYATTNNTYTAIRINTANQHFQLLNVENMGIGNGSNNNANVDSMYSYQQLVNYYVGLNPTTKAERAEARLIVCSRYAHWNAQSTFASEDSTTANVSVLQPSGATLFALDQLYNGLDKNGNTNSNFKIHGYTILSAQCGQGCSSFYNNSLHSYDVVSWNGLTKNGGTIKGQTDPKSVNAACVQMASAGGYMNRPYFWKSNTSFSRVYQIDVTVFGRIPSVATNPADTLQVYPVNSNGYNVDTLTNPSISLTESGDFQKTITMTLDWQTVSGLEIDLTALSAYFVYIYKVVGVLSYYTNSSGTKKTSTSLTDANMSDNNWDFSDATLINSFSSAYNDIFFGKYVREIEDHVIEGYLPNAEMSLFFPSTVEYVGRDLSSGSILYFSMVKKSRHTYCYLQTSTINKDWSPYFNITNDLSAASLSNTYIAVSTTGTINDGDLWDL